MMNERKVLLVVQLMLQLKYPNDEPVTEAQVKAIFEQMLKEGKLMRSGGQLLVTPKGREAFRNLNLKLSGGLN